MAEVAKYLLKWAGLPERYPRWQISNGLKFFPGEISGDIILKIIQIYGDQLSMSLKMPEGQEVMK
jgi:hypothetical protein